MQNKLSINKFVTLNNGVNIPTIGYGTYKASEDEVLYSVINAINNGYRLIDCASFYQNQVAVGKAIKASRINRNELFITSKVWNTERGYTNTIKSFNKTLEELGVEYLDLFLIHWPANYLQFKDEAKKINQETWRALEDLYLEGKVKAIGLSNFMAHHIEQIMETCKIKPMVNQIEFHPGANQSGVISYCNDHNIILEAWSPLGRGSVLNNELIVELATKYHKTPAQICLRYVVESGLIPLVKSVKVERIVDNLNIYDFELTKEDFDKIKALKITTVVTKDPDNIDF